MEDMASTEESGAEDFDFESHREQALADYSKLRALYEDYSRVVRDLVEAALADASVRPHSIEHRAKDPESFGEKASRRSDADPQHPKYREPLKDIHDLAGCRVITYFLNDVDKVRDVIEKEFTVIEKINRSSYLRGSGAPGYESYHFIVDLGPKRYGLTEYSRYSGRVVEIQVRTILQHAWAEIEHDIQYKSVEELPRDIARRFSELAGLIAIGDREFQAIADAHAEVLERAQQSIAEGRLDDVEITPETLKIHLDRRLGPDGRMSDWSYAWTTRLLKRLGFSSLGQVDRCLDEYDHDSLSRRVYGSRQGQLTRFELVIAAAVGPALWSARHPWSEDPDFDWFEEWSERKYKRIAEAGFEVGKCASELSRGAPPHVGRS